MLTYKEEFLRNIGHELKTPILKGKFLIENLDNDIKNNINKVFIDLEQFTNQLLQTERIEFVTLNKIDIDIETLLLDTLSKLVIEDTSIIEINIDENINLFVDRYYITMALKNLIDNAIKYSLSYPIKITINKVNIIIKNKANKLPNDLQYYTQPFTQGDNYQTKQGYGLGLGIVNKILNKHKFNLNYQYKEPYNIFTITF